LYIGGHGATRGRFLLPEKLRGVTLFLIITTLIADRVAPVRATHPAGAAEECL
jgi:hypothetical protein